MPNQSNKPLAPKSNNQKPRAFIGPQADKAFARIAAPEIKYRVLLGHLIYHVRTVLDLLIARPIGALLIRVWLYNLPGASLIEQAGLPRFAIENLLGTKSLILHVNPNELIQFTMHPPDTKKKPSANALIWDGDWDLCRVDLRTDYAIKLIQDLDANRNNLENTAKYKELTEQLNAGKPFSSHREGIYLNSKERILAYLQVYLDFLDNMAANGYQPQRTKDYLGVVVSREGRLLKTKRGAHRLAMAQHIGLPSIPVQVRHIHRQWWEQITQNTTRKESLKRLIKQLQKVKPEQEAGTIKPF